MNRSASGNVDRFRFSETPVLPGLLMTSFRMTIGYSVSVSKTLMLIDGLHNIYR